MKLNFKKIPLVMVENMFLSSLSLFVFALIIGFAVFLKCNLKEEEKSAEEIISFNYEIYEKINAIWEEEKIKVLEIENKEYPDPFSEKEKIFEEEKVD